MKAARVNGWGQPIQLEDIPQPEPASDEVLVRVHAASINPFDTFVHAGYLQGMISTPLTLGTDFSGEVVKVGPEVGHLKPGDAVFGLVPMHSGSFAEYLVAKGNEVTHKPKTLDFVQAAGVPLASLAAYQMVFELGQLQEGERVLIIGAAGAAGSCAAQLAKTARAYVYGVHRSDSEDFVRGLGVDRPIHSQKERFEDVTGTVDLVLDFVGENLERSYSILQPGGRYVTSLILSTPQEEAERRGIRVQALATRPNIADLDTLASDIDADRLKIFINCVYPFDDVQAAMDYRLKKSGPGKVALKVL